MLDCYRRQFVWSKPEQGIVSDLLAVLKCESLPRLVRGLVGEVYPHINYTEDHSYLVGHMSLTCDCYRMRLLRTAIA